MRSFLEKQWRRIVSAVLVAAMVFNMTPFSALNAFAFDVPLFTVNVIDENDTPVTNATVIVKDNEDVDVHVDNNGDGTYSFRADDGDFTINVAAEGYTEYEQAVTLESAVSTVIDVVLAAKVVEKSYTVSGTVTIDDAPAADIKVTESINGTEATTDAEGKYTFTGLTGEGVTVSVDTADGYIASADVAFGEETEITADLALVLKQFNIIFEADGGEFVEITGVTDGKAEYGKAVTFKFNPVADIEFTITDGADELTAEEGVYKIENITADHTVTVNVTADSGVPVVDAAVDSEDWTNSKVVTVTVTDNYDANVKVYVSETGTYTKDDFAQATDVTEVVDGKVVFDQTHDETGKTYYFYAVDAAGNFAEVKSVTVVKIDVTAPVFADVEATEPKDGKFTVSGSVSDEADGSGLAKVVFNTENDESTAKDLTVTENSFEFEVTKEEDGDVTAYLWAYDTAGNKVNTSVSRTIDKTAPEIKDVTANVDLTGWYTEIGYSFTVLDANAVTVTVDGNEVAPVGGVYEFTAIDNKDYKIVAVDAQNNRSEMAVKVERIDKASPVLTNIKVNPDKVTAGSVEVTGKVTDIGAGVKEVIFSTGAIDADGRKKAILDGENFTFTVDEEYNGTYNIYAVDNNENATAATPVEIIIDRSPAVVSSVVASATDWTKENVTVTISAEDVGPAGVGKVVYTLDKVNSVEELKDLPEATKVGGNYEFVVEKPVEGNVINNKYYVYAIDTVGNVDIITEKTVTVKIDCQAPVVSTADVIVNADDDTGHSANTSVNGQWTNKSVTVKGTVDAKGSSDVDKVVISTGAYDAADAKACTLSGTEYEFEISDETEKIFKIYAIDKMGNVSAPVEVTVKIDTKAPSVSADVILAEKDGNYVEAGSSVNDKWTNKAVVVEAEATDTVSEIVKVVYSTTELTEAQVRTSANVASLDNGKYIVPMSDAQEQKYFLYSVDEANNVSKEATVIVKIDKNDPTASADVLLAEKDGNDVAKGASVNNVWTNKGVVVNTAATDLDGNGKSGIAKVVYSKVELTDVDDIKELKDEAVFVAEAGNYQLPLDAEQEQDYYLYAIDNAGNVSAVTSVKVLIDLKAPSVDNIYVDGTDDIIGAFDNITFKHFYNKTVKISFVTSDKGGSGVNNNEVKFKYAKSIDDIKKLEKSTKYTAEFDLEPTTKGIFEVVVKDIAGNKATFYSNGIIVDINEPTYSDINTPEIKITIDETTKSGDFFNKNVENVEVNISVTDPAILEGAVNENGYYSGLGKLTYDLYAVKNTLVDSDIAIDDLDNTDNYKKLSAGTINLEEGTIDGDKLVKDITKVISVATADHNYNSVILVATAEDNAGNRTITRTKLGDMQIDITAPKVNVDVPANDVQNGTYFQGEKTATITVTERNFDKDLIKVRVLTAPTVAAMATTTTEYTNYELVWEETVAGENGDDTTNTATIKFPTDGHYKVEVVSLEDEAGNKAEEGGITYTGVAGGVFTIDTVNPVINVTYDNNAVVNDRYFAGFRTATVVITEHNLDAEKVKTTITAALNGAAIGAPAVSWSTSGDNHTAVISYAADGDYTFDISAIDLAGRNNNNVIYSGAAPQSFTVDTTIENPVISGVANGVAYKGSVIPSIAFTDVNYQTHTITLLRTRMNERNVNVTAELLGTATLTGQGFSLTAANFEQIRENDGIYTLTATATDMAGNESTSTVTFTVNRFGSVYVFSEYLSDLIADGGKYVPSVTEDLIVTEYNPDKLVENSLIIEISRDGKPVDGEFSVTPDINEYVALGESGWYQYRYTINKANFDKDGIYKISISSQDETGNYPEISNFEDMSIQFKVDSTAPEITSIVGLEEAIVNAQALDVKYTLFDAIALKSVKLYINGQLAEEINEFSDLNNFEGKFTLGESTSRQSVRLVVEDMAGNITDTSAESFESAYVFNPEVTVSTNVFVRWFANKPLFFGSIGGAVAAAAAVYYFIGKKKRENEEV